MQKKIPSELLYTACTYITVHTVNTAFTVYIVDTVYTVCTTYTALTVDNASTAHTAYFRETCGMEWRGWIISLECNDY